MALRQRHDRRQQVPLGGRRLGIARRGFAHVDADQSDDENDDVPSVRRLESRRHMGERMRIAHRDQDVPGRASTSFSDRSGAARRSNASGSSTADVAGCDRRVRASTRLSAATAARVATEGMSPATISAAMLRATSVPAPTRPHGSSRVPCRRLNGAWYGLSEGQDPPQPHDRGNVEDERRRDRGRIDARQPGDPPATGQHEKQRADRRNIRRARGRAERRMEKRETFRQRPLGRQPHEEAFQIHECHVRRRQQQQHRGSDQRHHQQIAEPQGSCDMPGDADQGSVRPASPVRPRGPAARTGTSRSRPRAGRTPA